MSKIISISLFLLFNLVALANETAQEQFEQALEAQNSGNIDQSITRYQQLLDTENYSPTVYNNLGLAYATKGNIGKAVLNFERALVLDANFLPAQNNLKAVQQQIANPIPTLPKVFFVRWWNGLSGLFSAMTWSILFLTLLIGGFSLFAVGYWQINSFYKKIGIGLAIFSMLPFIWAAQQTSLLQDDSMAIVTAKAVGIRQHPELGSTEMEIISAGVKVKVIDRQENWLHIQLPNSLVGWVPQKMITRIKK